jgi:hypothetical protein
MKLSIVRKPVTAEGESLWQWRDLETAAVAEQNRTLQIAAESAYRDYCNGGDLVGFDAFDGIYEY